ncbi:MAG: cell wall-binding repeat-containing protein, partial [Corynebacterium sp.]|nr:cell wall-binding repeat-containing protein [Corynebacterium sp.]
MITPVHTVRPLSLAALAVTGGLVLSGCGAGTLTGSGDGGQRALETNGQEVVADADGTGVEVSRRLFDSANAVVVSSPERDDQLLAAAIAAKLGAPMLVRLPGTDAAVDAEVDRLGAERVVTVPGDDEAVVSTEPVVSADPVADIQAVLALDPANPLDLKLPPMFATEATSVAAAATSRAAGAPVSLLPAADPRATSESMATVQEQDTIALGAQWGTTEDYTHRAALASNGELPGGGGLVFPGRRMIALYGHPSGPALGIMGEQGPAEAAELARQYAAQYQPLEEQPVIPAFEIIVTVASDSPGDDGDYSNETDPADVVPYLD